MLPGVLSWQVETLENYLDSFENNLKKEFAQKLTMFKRLENAS